jgi:ABC-type nitrate/sulfonate/bicarbonate transport system substrate-binding protein
VAAAFAGKLDVFFAGDQPAINLIARGGKWKIVARLFDDGVGIIVPPNSPIQSVEDLEGKTVASPFGSVAHRDAFLAQEAVGLDPLADVENQNLDILEIRRRVLAGGNERWNDIDAAVVWDPIISGLELEGLARSVTSRKYLGVIVVSEAFIDAHPEAVVQLLVALMRSWDSFARQPDRVMQWYIDDTRLDYTAESLVAARLDPNFEATTLSGISLALDADYMAILARSAEWARDSGEGDVLVAQAVNTTLLTEAVRVVAENQFEDIEVILPSTEETAHERDGLFYELDSAPLVVVFAVMVLIAMLAIESGFTLGKSNREKIQEEQVTPIATVVGAVLALMAFVIAFTFVSGPTSSPNPTAPPYAACCAITFRRAPASSTPTDSRTPCVWSRSGPRCCRN